MSEEACKEVKIPHNENGYENFQISFDQLVEKWFIDNIDLETICLSLLIWNNMINNSDKILEIIIVIILLLPR